MTTSLRRPVLVDESKLEPEYKESGERVSSPEDMQEHAFAVLETAFSIRGTTLSYDEMVRVDEVENPTDPSLPPMQVPLYDLQWSKFSFREAGAIGRAPRHAFDSACAIAVDSIDKRLRAVQPAADWRFAGYRMSRRNVYGIRRDRPEGSTPNPALNLLGLIENMEKSGKLPSGATSFQRRPEYELVIEVAMVNESRGALRDPLAEQGRVGPIARFLDQRSMRTMPQGMRAARDKALSVLAHYFDTAAPAAPQRPEAKRTETVQVKDGLTNEQVAAAYDMREQGIPLGVVAQLLAVTHQKLSAAFRVGEAEGWLQPSHKDPEPPQDENAPVDFAAATE